MAATITNHHAAIVTANGFVPQQGGEPIMFLCMVKQHIQLCCALSNNDSPTLSSRSPFQGKLLLFYGERDDPKNFGPTTAELLFEPKKLVVADYDEYMSRD
jgi:hypothetical protein